MFLESKIMTEVILQLKELNIVALPVFDAIVVKASDEGVAKDVMLEKFKATTNLEGVVRRESA